MSGKTGMLRWLVALALVALAWATLGPAQAVARADETGPGATLTQSGWARVVDAVAPHLLRVQDGDAPPFIIWHIGVIGPPLRADDSDEPEGSGASDFTRATQLHAELLPAGTPVWVEREPGLDNPDPRIALAHVLGGGDSETPVGARLLRAGAVWVYPHARHRYTPSYADRQAEAALARAGLWGETGSTAVFRPTGEAHGGFPHSPRVRPALLALDGSPIGQPTLQAVNEFPVEIGVTPLPADVLGVFVPRLYTIQLSSAIMGAEPESVAAVLLHELVHTQGMIEDAVTGTSTGCYEAEEQAFGAAARYWEATHGPSGKARLTHPLDDFLNALLREYQSGTLATFLRDAYREQCEQFEASAGSAPLRPRVFLSRLSLRPGRAGRPAASRPPRSHRVPGRYWSGGPPRRDVDLRLTRRNGAANVAGGGLGCSRGALDVTERARARPPDAGARPGGSRRMRSGELAWGCTRCTAVR